MLALSLLLSVFLALGAHPAAADIHITLRNMSDRGMPYPSYNSLELFKLNFANIRGSISGYLHQPWGSREGCESIPLIPSSYASPKDESNERVQWIAVFDGYPNCPEALVNSARMAGYSLILILSSNGSDSGVLNLGFPIAIIVDEKYHRTIETTLSDFEEPEVLATVKANRTTIIATAVPVSVCVVFICCLFCCLCLCWCWVRRRRRRRRRYEAAFIEQQRQNYNRYQNRHRLARQELVESILRQLHQLQLDTQTQRPLGATSTKQLPTKEYQMTASGSPESCAICVEDFREGNLLRVLPCDHYFHLDCIDEWLINHSDLCPLCKHQVPRQDSDGVQYQARGLGWGVRGIGAGNLVTLTDDEGETDYSSDFSIDSNDSRNRLVMAAEGGARYGSV